MYNQGPTAGRVNPPFRDPPAEQDPSRKHMPPPYQEPAPTGVSVQPTVFLISTPAADPIPDYLYYSIFTLLCCFFPLGIAAVVCSANTRSSNSAGQQDSARKSSRTALILNHVSVGLGLGFLLYALIMVISLHRAGVF